MANPSRVAFTLFGRDIYWYGILMTVGIILAVLLAQNESKRKKLYHDAMIDLCLLIIPLGVIGARLYYVLFELDVYLKDPITILYIWEGGLAIYGAVIAGLIGAFFFARKKKIRFLRLVDCIVPGLALAQAIGRWGNFFNQEAFGSPVTNEALIWFPMAVRIEGYHTFNGMACSNPYHLATFFYESMWCLLIFILLWSQRKKFRHDGDALICYTALYSFERMFIEGLRGDSLYLIRPDAVGFLPAGIRVSQLLSALLFAAAVIFLIVRALRERRLGRPIWPSPEDEPDGEAGDEPKSDGGPEPYGEPDGESPPEDEPDGGPEPDGETSDEPKSDGGPEPDGETSGESPPEDEPDGGPEPDGETSDKPKSDGGPEPDGEAGDEPAPDVDEFNPIDEDEENLAKMPAPAHPDKDDSCIEDDLMAGESIYEASGHEYVMDDEEKNRDKVGY